MAARKSAQQAVLITTQHRGVFFGTLLSEANNGKTVELKDARCAIYWGTAGGFLELAGKGPNSKSKIGAVAPQVTLHDVTSKSVCSAEAAEAWRKA